MKQLDGDFIYFVFWVLPGSLANAEMVLHNVKTIGFSPVLVQFLFYNLDFPPVSCMDTFFSVLDASVSSHYASV